MKSPFTISSETTLNLAHKLGSFYKKNSNQDGVYSFIHRNISCRIGSLALLIISPITATCDLIIGTGAAVASIATFGAIQPLNTVASNMTLIGGSVLSSFTYVSLITLINPAAKIDTEKNGPAATLNIKILTFASHLKYSNSLIKKHVFSRFAYFGFTLSSIVARIIDFVIGILSAVASILTLGKIKSLNTFAHSGLPISLLVNDIYIGLLKVINPWADFQ